MSDLLNRFSLYPVGTDFMLPTLAAYQALPAELQPLYTLVEEEMVKHLYGDLHTGHDRCLYDSVEQLD